MRKRVKHLLLWTLPFIVVIAGASFIVFSPLFQIEEITIVGNNKVSDEELIRVLPFVKGNRLPLIHCDYAEKILLGDKRIGWAEVHRRYPNRVDVVIEEMAPVLLLSAGKIWGINESGRLLPIESSYEMPNIPFLSGIGEEVSIEPYKKISSVRLSSGLEFWKVANETSPQMLDEISEIIVDTQKNIRVVLIDDGLVVDFGPNNFDRRIKRLESILKDLGVKRQAVECIDLRYSDQAIVRYDKTAQKQLVG